MVYMFVSKCDMRWLGLSSVHSKKLVSPFICSQLACERWSEEKKREDKNNIVLVLQPRPTRAVFEYRRSRWGLESGSIPASRRFPFWQKTPKLCPPSASNFTLETLAWTCSDRCWESLLFVESGWLLRWYIRKICSGKHFVLEIYSAQKLDVLFLLLCVYRQKMFCSQMCGNKSWIICQLSSQSSWMNNEQN